MPQSRQWVEGRQELLSAGFDWTAIQNVPDRLLPVYKWMSFIILKECLTLKNGCKINCWMDRLGEKHPGNSLVYISTLWVQPLFPSPPCLQHLMLCNWIKLNWTWQDFCIFSMGGISFCREIKLRRKIQLELHGEEKRLHCLFQTTSPETECTKTKYAERIHGKCAHFPSVPTHRENKHMIRRFVLCTVLVHTTLRIPLFL